MKKRKVIPDLCPVCHYTMAAFFFEGPQQPLATLGWPSSLVQAKNMEKLPLHYMQCPKCTHVWNKSFSYEQIPYKNNPNRMYNDGSVWQGHLSETRSICLNNLPKNPTIIDVGCGEGHFVRGLSKSCKGIGRFIGFDPNTSSSNGKEIEFIPRYFDPLNDIKEFKPDLIVMRHVLEHLTDPANFVEQLAWGSAISQHKVLFFSEMPCIDRVFRTGRLSDFFYEHPSQFTTKSFKTLMERGGDILELSHGYNNEVIFALVDLSIQKDFLLQSEFSNHFYDQSNKSINDISIQLSNLVNKYKSIVIWGGTGKSSAFINHFKITQELIPLVVDSDAGKVGTFVPGTGQKIESRDILKESYTDIVIIPAQWRAKDILAEIQKEKIKFGCILIEHNGMLIDFIKEQNPYQ